MNINKYKKQIFYPFLSLIVVSSLSMISLGFTNYKEPSNNFYNNKTISARQSFTYKANDKFRFKNEKKLVEKIKVLSTKYKNNINFDFLNTKEKKEILILQKEMQKFLGFNFQKLSEKNIRGKPFGRYWSEWWGANLWINLTKSETSQWINKLRINYDLGQYTGQAFEFVDNIAGSVNTGNDKIDNFAAFISLLAKVGSGISNYFDWKYLNNLSGGGTLSYRFTFGFIPSGVYKGYKDL